MKPLYTQEQYDNSRHYDELPMECDKCGGRFLKRKNALMASQKNGQINHHCGKCQKPREKSQVEVECFVCGKKFFKYMNRSNPISCCSLECGRKKQSKIYPILTKNCELCGVEFKVSSKLFKIRKYCGKECGSVVKKRHKKAGIIINCKNCNKLVREVPSIFKKQGRKFCGRQCANNYNMNNCREVSKLETFMQEALIARYPDLSFSFNDRKVIRYELDVYIMSLGLAFEINGPCHYRNIYGENFLKAKQKNDEIKLRICPDFGIDLKIIDSSKQPNANLENSQPYISQVYEAIDKKIEELKNSFDPQI